jgi:hypothetical protein
MNAAVALATVADETQRLLDLLAPGEPVTFQTFDDDKGRRAANGKRDPFARILHGTLGQHRATLADLNARGAGIFWMVNAGDGGGRSNKSVRRIRALFVDLDGAPLEPVQASPLQPHCIVESSPGRWHAYWRIADCPLPDFTPLQKNLIARFNADESVHDLCRVMRLPGFLHRKGKPFETRIIECHERAPYTLAEFRSAFGFAAIAKVAKSSPAPRTLPQPMRAMPQRQRRTLPDRIPEGARKSTLLSLAAGFVRRGFDLRQTNERLQKINAERCDPPLCATEVDEVVLCAFAYGSDGFRIFPDRLIDSAELNGLPHPSRWIIITALRRYDGTNNGNIALTHTDCRSIPGCADERAFIRYRTQAVASGILILAKQGCMTRNGKTPNLYAINPRFLWSHTRQITQLAHTG